MIALAQEGAGVIPPPPRFNAGKKIALEAGAACIAERPAAATTAAGRFDDCVT